MLFLGRFRGLHGICRFHRQGEFPSITLDEIFAFFCGCFCLLKGDVFLHGNLNKNNLFSELSGDVDAQHDHDFILQVIFLTMSSHTSHERPSYFP